MKAQKTQKKAPAKKVAKKAVKKQKPKQSEIKSFGYTDIYLLPLPKENLEKYRKTADHFGKLAKEYGAIEYREFMADDLFPKGTLSFSEATRPLEGELVIAAVVDFKTKAHRNEVMKKLFKDKRMASMMKAEPLADMRKMYYGGFVTIVKA
ncbi:MAG: hypothetical protein RL641_414 [Candidatus Parcubacteria bacterium]|jgi:uncharacterized protein YbaA (DUF1428 family)